MKVPRRRNWLQVRSYKDSITSPKWTEPENLHLQCGFHSHFHISRVWLFEVWCMEIIIHLVLDRPRLQHQLQLGLRFCNPAARLAPGVLELGFSAWQVHANCRRCWGYTAPAWRPGSWAIATFQAAATFTSACSDKLLHLYLSLFCQQAAGGTSSAASKCVLKAERSRALQEFYPWLRLEKRTDHVCKKVLRRDTGPLMRSPSGSNSKQACFRSSETSLNEPLKNPLLMLVRNRNKTIG